MRRVIFGKLLYCFPYKRNETVSMGGGRLE
jgi:hypothetical protein